MERWERPWRIFRTLGIPLLDWAVDAGYSAIIVRARHRRAVLEALGLPPNTQAEEVVAKGWRWIFVGEDS